MNKLIDTKGLKRAIENIKSFINKNYITEVTYEELVELRNNSKLIPGKQYRIIDYITTTAQENTKSAGHQFDIIVTADDEKTLNENARAIQHKDDTYFNTSNLSTWEIKYCLDNDLYYTWSGERDFLEQIDGDGFIYQQNLNDLPIVNLQIKNGNTNIDGQFYCLTGEDQEDINSNQFSIDVAKINDLNKGECLHIELDIETFAEITGIYGNDIEFGGHTIDTVDKNNIIIINNKHYYSLLRGSNQIVSVNYETEKIIYTYHLDIGDRGTYEVIKGTKQKGVIYYMKDEYGNEAPYDFKNILYLESEHFMDDYSPGYYYTFSKVNDNIILDNTIIDNNPIAKGNIIKKRKFISQIGLNNIKLISTSNYNNNNNIFDYDCFNIYISSDSSNNIFKGECHSITIKKDSGYNYFYNCSDIKFEKGECSYNKFFNSSNIRLRDTSCNNNIIYDECRNIKIYSSNNIYYQLCSSIDVNCYNTIFHQLCNSIRCSNFITHSIFEQHVKNINIECTKSKTPSIYVDTSVRYASMNTIVFDNSHDRSFYKITHNYNTDEPIIYSNEDIILSCVPYKLEHSLLEGSEIHIDDLNDIGLTPYILKNIHSGKISKILDNRGTPMFVTFADETLFILSKFGFTTDGNAPLDYLTQYKFTLIDEESYDIEHIDI